MSARVKLFMCLALALLLFGLLPAALGYGTGAKVYLPSQRNITASSPAFTYNDSFMVYNDGYRAGVYIIRVSVTEPDAIDWLTLSSPVFTLNPGQSKLVYFSFNTSDGQPIPGTYEFIFMPTILTTNVEPYMEDQFANYTSMADMFSFNLTIPGNTMSASAFQPGNQVFFPINASRVNLVQDSVLENNSNVVTLLDRAIKLNAPDSAAIGQPVPISTSIFEGLNSQGISLMAVSPDDILYPISPGNFTFNKIGLWGIVVLDGDDIIIGKTVDVTAMKSPLEGLDVGTVLAGISLLVLLSVVPIWLMGPGKLAMDPYADITYKAYVIRKYIDKFDRERLQRAVKVLKEDYDGLIAKKAPGSREEARRAIEELSTLANF
jgi:hypothetical protein